MPPETFLQSFAVQQWKSKATHCNNLGLTCLSFVYRGQAIRNICANLSVGTQNSKENNLLNDYSAKMALGLFWQNLAEVFQLFYSI